MSFIVVIPARYASSRLPGKPLADIAGKSMIRRVYEQAKKTAADQVYVATDDQRVAEEVQNWGGNVLMTDPSHQSGTDRLAEVAQKLNLEEDQILVNLQGDEPLMPPEVIDQVAENLQSHPECSVATLCEPIQLKEDFLNPAVVKVVADTNNMALYFSRAPIPWPRDVNLDSEILPEPLNAKRHLGIYAYRAGFLQQFVNWNVAELEHTEMLEQLRVLAEGQSIHVELSCAEVPAGIDTQQDLERIRGLFSK